MNITALLNSLHTHLQSQTQLLPTLHAQLGLPPTALQNEIETLQHKLIASVAAQIDVRRKEVEGWMGRCEEVEKECLRYTKALGGNIKATGTSVGELRKEQVLPRRFETVAEYQEKLRQLYHTKLEQLTTLTNRLNVLSRTLGPDYFSQDIIEAAPAAGESTDDPGAHRDVTPERFSKLEKELVRGKAEVSKRLIQLAELFTQIDWLYTELGISQPSPDDYTTPSSPDPFLSAPISTPTPPSRSSSSTTPITLPSSSTSTTSQDHEFQHIFARFVALTSDLDTPPPSPSYGLENVEPTPVLLSWASSTLHTLTDLRRRRETHIQAMYDQLEVLWRRLGVSESDMDAFVEVNRGSTEESVRAYEEELERMLEVKRERMGEFVENAREEIWKLWEEVMVGEEERRDFAPFVDDEYTEELLSIHEAEIQRLKEERKQKAPLLASIKKYFEICEEEKELAAAASDQTRLLGRGTGGNRDPGRLLREEKMRRRVKKEKPRLEQDLLASIPAWEQETGRPFLVHGESILQVLMETVSAADQENNSKRKHARTGSGSSNGGGTSTSRNTYLAGSRHGHVPSRATTPVDLNGKGVVTPAVRPASSMTGAGAHLTSSKRPRLASANVGDNGQTPRTGNGVRPLGESNHNSRGPGARAVSPTKIPGRASGNATVAKPVALPMQQYALGHGRVPSSFPKGAGVDSGYMRAMSTATTSSQGLGSSVYGMGIGRFGVGAGSGSAGVSTKMQKVKKESFKPRPSVDVDDVGVGGVGMRRWPGGHGMLGKSVKEEE